MVKRCQAHIANRRTRASVGACPEVSGAKEDEGYQQRACREARGDPGNQKPSLPFELSVCRILRLAKHRKMITDSHRLTKMAVCCGVGVGLATHLILNGRRQARHPLAGSRLASRTQRRAWHKRDDGARDLPRFVDEAVI